MLKTSESMGLLGLFCEVLAPQRYNLKILAMMQARKHYTFSSARGMGEIILGQLKQFTENHTNKYDKEWIHLISLAKKYGLSTEEVRKHLNGVKDANTTNRQSR